MQDESLFAEESSGGEAAAPEGNAWKVLVVDDEPEVHSVTALALGDMSVLGRPIHLLNAYSGAECIEMLRNEEDIALILLDVVMESDTAGLDAVKTIRNELGKKDVRIVLRTGQPGQAPERSVVAEYEINDYKSKTELTSNKLFTTVHTALMSYRDIKALREQKEKLEKQAQELRESNQELEQFAYIASHDLQAPLRGIVGFCQLLQRRYQGQLDSEADEFIENITRSAQNMQALVNDLLALSRVGRLDVTMREISLGEVVNTAISRLEPLGSESGLEVEVGELPRLTVDPGQFMQLFQNLISNAIKFRREGEKPKVVIKAEEQEKEWLFSLQDNGIGIPAEHRDRIFEVFQRLHTADAYEGTGIGLAICRKVAKFHSGRIWVESEPNAGSTFYFTVPKLG